MLPLEGIRILDLGQYITGPFATVLLAELGADVIKVEPPTGDPFRSWEGGPLKATFMAFNRGKRSIVLDLKADDGREKFLRLVRTADALVENFRPGVMQRLGVGPEECKQANPGLIFCSISGFGSSGPYAELPAFDGVALAYSGMAGLLTEPSDPRFRGPALGDTITGYAAALNLLAQLLMRKGTGAGATVEVSMLGSLVHFLQPTVFRRILEDIEETQATRPKNSQAFVFTCSDRRMLAIHLSAPVKFWEGLCTATGRLDLLEDPRFIKRAGRRENHDELHAELAPIFASDLRDTWVARLQDASVPAAPVNSIGEAITDPGLLHLGILDHAHDDRFGMVPRLRPPALVDGRPLEPVVAAPLLDEHTDEVLREIEA